MDRLSSPYVRRKTISPPLDAGPQPDRYLDETSRVLERSINDLQHRLGKPTATDMPRFQGNHFSASGESRASSPGNFTGRLPDIPKFMPSNTNTFFSVLENMFERYTIVSQYERFEKLVLALHPSEIARVNTDLIIASSQCPYDHLKRCLIMEFAPTKNQRLELFLHGYEPSDNVPSVILRELKYLLGPDKLNESLAQELLRKRFFDYLPISIRSVLASQPGRDLDELADMADRIHAEINQPGQADDRSRSVDSVLLDLTTKVDKLAKQLDRISYNRGSQPHNRNSQNRSGSYNRHYNRRDDEHSYGAESQTGNFRSGFASRTDIPSERHHTNRSRSLHTPQSAGKYAAYSVATTRANSSWNDYLRATAVSSVGTAPRGHLSNLLSIRDQSRNISFLFDSGSCVIVLPNSLIDPTLVADPTSGLIVINGSAVTRAAESQEGPQGRASLRAPCQSIGNYGHTTKFILLGPR